ncbi:MAG TPA: FAD-dependent oxidoreductase, partial [Burkholderiales bacterium]|nr:FAD-dependent oxidoreductase [Burkholderiales bacterium]
METQVAVVGGGYAGLAAAVSLAGHGIAVTLFESSKTLGGRARGIPCNGSMLDNGQHILLGCYTETLALIEKTCEIAEPFSRFPLELSIDDFFLRSFRLPPPLDLLAGLLFSQGLSLADRLSAIRFMARTKQSMQSADFSVAELMQRNRQSENLVRFLWGPLCISALNTPIETASSRVFLSVLRDGLNGTGSDIIIPKVDLSTLFPLGAAKRVRDRGGHILLSTPVRAIRKAGGAFEVETDSAAHIFSH